MFPLYFIVRPVVALVKSFYEVIDPFKIANDASHVPTFYAPYDDQGRSNTSDLLVFGVALPIVAALFGGLHLIAWRFHFPSCTDQLLWRSYNFCYPNYLALILSVLVSMKFLKTKVRLRLSATNAGILQRVKESSQVVLVLVIYSLAGAVAYMFARLLLLTQAVVLLRQQPDFAFYAIDICERKASFPIWKLASVDYFKHD